MENIKSLAKEIVEEVRKHESDYDAIDAIEDILKKEVRVLKQS